MAIFYRMKLNTRLFLAAATACVLVSCGGSSSSSSQAPDYEMNYTVSEVTFDMVKVPSGYFTMGLSQDNRQKVSGSTIHPVALDGFVITATPVSQALWTAVMGSNPSSVQNPSLPVDMVSWGEVHKFISKLNKATGKTFSLPTEAQWEYAAGLQGKDFVSVAEWMEDTFSELPDSFVVNPATPKPTDHKVVRTVKDRLEIDSHTKKAGVGFRLVQPTGEALSESLLKVLDGASFDRETVDDTDVESLDPCCVEDGQLFAAGNLAALLRVFIQPDHVDQMTLDERRVDDQDLTVVVYVAPEDRRAAADRRDTGSRCDQKRQNQRE